MFKNKVLLILFIGACLAFVSTQYLLFVTDISTRELPASYIKHMTAKRPRVHLISYADGHEMFYRNQLTLAHSSLGRGVDTITNYNRSMLDPAFVKKNAHIFKHKTGGGYWLWKPWVIVETLRKIPEGDILIYADTGFVLKKDLTKLVDELTEQDILVFQGDHEKYGRLINNAKPEVFREVGVSPEVAQDKWLIFGGFLVIRNTSRARDFFYQWLKYCENDVLLTDFPSRLPLPRSYVKHVHDQSVLSVLALKYPEIIKRFSFDDYLLKNFAVWHHRKPGIIADDSLYEYRSLAPYYAKAKEMSLFEKIFYNNIILKMIRKYI